MCALNVFSISLIESSLITRAHRYYTIQVVTRSYNIFIHPGIEYIITTNQLVVYSIY